MLDAALTPRKIALEKQEHIAVIIDVFRASTTICTALATGAARVIPVRSVAEARRKRLQFGGSFAGGERKGLPPKGFDAGNSPFEYSSARVAGKTVIFTTTNGTTALLSAPEHSTRIIGCFANANAVCDFIIRRNPVAVTLICAGNNGSFSYEDALCAGMLAGKLSGHFLLTDEARAAAAIYSAAGADSDTILRTTRHASALKELGFTRDVELCITSDTLNVVPVYHENSLIIY